MNAFGISIVSATFVLNFSLSGDAFGQTCDEQIKWNASIYKENTDYVSIVIDANNIGNNRYLTDIDFTIKLANASTPQLGRLNRKQIPNFDNLRGLRAGIYQLYLPHFQPSATMAIGEELRLLCKIDGAAQMSSRSTIQPSGAVISSQPKALNSKPNNKIAISATVSASDFAGLWGNTNRNLNFVQFLRITALSPQRLSVEAWLRCPTPARWAQRSQCVHWATTIANLDVGSAKVVWIYSPEPRVGHNAISVSHPLLHLHTQVGNGDAWLNEFSRME